jgi:hypothetical protein
LVIERHGRIWLLAIGGFGLVGLVLTLLRLPAWKDDLSLWTAELAREPDNPYAMGGMGRAWLGEGRDSEGVQIWERAVDLAPQDIRLFPVQEERYLLAQTALGLAMQERLPIERATELSLKMSCQMLDEHQQSGQGLPEDFAILVNDSFRLRGEEARPRDFLSYCTGTASAAAPVRSE